MENFKLITDNINITWAHEELVTNGGGWWQQITARQDTPGTCHQDTETIFFRWSADQSIEAVFTDLKAVNYPAMEGLPCVKELVIKAHGIVGGELGRAILVKLKPGGEITPHIDEGLYADYYDRFHLPIVSRVGNNLYVGEDERSGEYCHMLPGELWWFDHKKKHFAVNSSNDDRLHLIIDIKADQFRGHREVSKRTD